MSSFASSCSVKNEVVIQTPETYMSSKNTYLKNNFPSIMMIMPSHPAVPPEIKDPCPFSSNFDAHPCFCTDML